MKHILCGVLMLFTIFSAKAQDTPPPTDNLETDPARNFNLVFTRGLMMTGGKRDSVPINGAGSGSWSIGAGIKAPLLKDRLGLRITPAFTLTRISYDQTTLKSFPSVPDSLDFQLSRESHNLYAPELSLGVYLNLSHDEDGDTRLFVEAGGYVGYLTGASYRRAYTNSANLRVDEKIRDLERVEDEFVRLKYGLYGRFGYKWAAAYVGIRLTDVFDELTNDMFKPRQVAVYRNPLIPPMELGLSLLF
ncbi:MAG: hypothetical protein SF053_16890 [Bacteroidia bacterium]|nr:hypothetical protein [Bacteroidia bacterium]